MLGIRKWLPVALIALAVLTAGAVYLLRFGKEEQLVFEQNKGQKEEVIGSGDDLQVHSQDRETDRQTVPSDTEDPSVCVHVCGSVRQEGIYYLSGEARVADAIEAAGGFDAEAAASYLNLAARLADGTKVYVPSLTEVEEGRVPAVTERYATDGASPAASYSGKININTADVQSLITLPGIGEARAKDIIAWREAHGGFSEISDIMKVSGIKEAMFEKIKDRISVR